MDTTSAESDPEPTASGPTVTGRVVDVLEAFDDTRRTMTLSELSRHSGLPLTTTHRLATELLPTTESTHAQNW